MSHDDAKTAARRQAFAARKSAHAAGQGAAADHLLRAILAGPVGIVAGYMPIRTEIDPLPAMAALVTAGHRVCVPVIRAAATPLAFHEWTPEAEMIDGPFGARVPRDGAVLEPDTLIVPLVAFSSAGDRLGYGGGFYDRTLMGLRARKPVRAIGFAFAAQRMDLAPEPTDEPLDLIVTETGPLAPLRPRG